MKCISISGGTIDSVTDKLEIFDIMKFNNLIIIVGGNDASNKIDRESFHDKYNNLIKSVKLKNSKHKLFLCTSCPPGDTDVTGINDVILQLCQENNLTCIDVNVNFYDKRKKNELRHHFYKSRDSIHLSQSGTKRLLGTINNHIPVVENFEKCVFTLYQSRQIQKTNNEKRTYTRQPKQGNEFQSGERPPNTQTRNTTYQGSSRSDHNWKGHYNGHHEDSAVKYTQSRSAAYQGSARSDHGWHGHNHGHHDEPQQIGHLNAA